jgi:hypothetical protein
MSQHLDEEPDEKRDTDSQRNHEEDGWPAALLLASHLISLRSAAACRRFESGAKAPHSKGQLQ